MGIPIGTRSLLWGAHQFILHPFYVALAWWRMYGFPWDPRLWTAFFVHDWGYWGKTDMDGDSGKDHPVLGGKIMGRLYGDDWRWFSETHSRSFAKSTRQVMSRLAAADKLASALVPLPLYVASVVLTGEHHEYIKMGDDYLRRRPQMFGNEFTGFRSVWHWGSWVQGHFRTKAAELQSDKARAAIWIESRKIPVEALSGKRPLVKNASLESVWVDMKDGRKISLYQYMVEKGKNVKDVG